MLYARRHRRFNADIVITPLIDTAWTLLIIFIITSPVLFRGIDIKLPRSSANNIKPDVRKIITINRDHSIYIDKERYSLNQLEPALAAIKGGNPDVSVYLRADRDVPYGIVVSVMDLLKRSGIDRLGMVTEPVPKSGQQ